MASSARAAVPVRLPAWARLRHSRSPRERRATAHGTRRGFTRLHSFRTDTNARIRTSRKCPRDRGSRAEFPSRVARAPRLVCGQLARDAPTPAVTPATPEPGACRRRREPCAGIRRPAMRAGSALMRTTSWHAPVAAFALAAVAILASTSRGAGPFSFPHRPHLSAATIAAGGGGGDADCRVCHDYSKGEREPHLAGCEKCHVDGDHLEVKRAAAAPARPAFQHKEHLFDANGAARKDVTCLTCHAPMADGDWIEYSVPTAGLGPRGTASRGGGASGEKTCADCHAAHEPAGGLVKQDERTGDGKACASCHLKDASILPLKYAPGPRTPGERPFSHADHGGAAAECAACHDAIVKSKTIWDNDPSK